MVVLARTNLACFMASLKSFRNASTSSGVIWLTEFEVDLCGTFIKETESILKSYLAKGRLLVKTLHLLLKNEKQVY